MEESVVYDDRMSDSDALMWNVERDPLLRSTITGAWLLDRAPDRARLRERAERALHRIPRLRQRVAANPFSIAPQRASVFARFIGLLATMGLVFRAPERSSGAHDAPLPGRRRGGGHGPKPRWHRGRRARALR